MKKITQWWMEYNNLDIFVTYNSVLKNYPSKFVFQNLASHAFFDIINSSSLSLPTSENKLP